ncbi:Hypothetical protein RG1141_CH01770 [Neorhizobium galegae bv. officinalis bv. officinalis str. HAMBI 1141]|uniref:Uncharacterized protein n=1 Tax=Neorhizobium galegae bv. officinalis bv. officinalis str. HAMBI 1141 TaxID=1028801 RepID=A0A068T259_NEOGA|nr:hypothetical protein [Neorhizobium galegae]CDN52542.1 Hypothetical protein RG1141_CH01770 [Neorhizobium galegae bv. officinalis bv. officinalis str. HAMBI 1141]
MGWVPDNVIEEMRGSHTLGIFMHVATDPPLHVWFGAEDLPANFDSVDETGAIYLGGGILNGLPTLEVLLNGASDAVDFSLSGIDPVTGAEMIGSIPPLRGKAVTIGVTTLDDYFQPMSSIIPLWQGIASHLTEQSAPVRSDQAPTLTLSLSVMAGEASRSRPSRSLWSSPHQKAISATDKFCDDTARLGRGVQPAWGLGY